MAREDTRQLVSTLGPNDKRKIDEYLTSVREIEVRIEKAEKDTTQVSPGIEKPSGIPVSFLEYSTLMFDLAVIAFQTDLTRINTIMLGREGSNRVYPEIGIPDPHHPLTHHRNNADWIEKVRQINVLHTQMFAYYLGKLKAASEADGTLLDNSMIVYGSGLADGNRHSHEDLPIILAGRAGGSLQPGRYVRMKDGTPMTSLYLTLLERMGVRPEKIGDSNGKLELLSDL